MADQQLELRLGHARIDVTPPLGIPMGGYAARDHGCEEIEERLFADAIYLEQGDVKTVWLTLDLISVHETWGRKVREGIEGRLGVPWGQILLLPSHTHFGPATGIYETIEEESHRAYVDDLVQRLIDAAVQAAADPVAVTASFGRADVSPMVYNRRLRRPDGSCCMVLRLPLPEGEEGLEFGPIEPNLTVLRFDKGDGTPVMALYSVAIHPVIGGGNYYGISPDYPGVVRRILEPALGAPVAFALGTAGNLVPIQRGEGQRERIGRFLAGAALEAFSTSMPLASDLRITHERVELPAAERLSPDEMQRQVDEAGSTAASLRQSGDARARRQADERHRRLQSVAEYAKLVGPGNTIPFEVSAIGLGEFGIVTMPGEIFVETGLHLQARSPFPHTLALSLANQATGYLPTRTAFWEGGYETSVSRMSEESEAAACEVANRLLVEVWDRQNAPGIKESAAS